MMGICLTCHRSKTCK
ncbi:hypothetical protein [Hahella sp. HN01]